MQFQKGEPVRFISHLDLLRTLSRALRRSGLPVSYSQGFNPHILSSFAMPLSVGSTSESEYADVEFDAAIDFRVIKKKLNAVLPEGLKILSVSEPKAAFKNITKAAYVATFEIDGMDAAVFSEKVRELLAGESVMAIKKSKKGDREFNIIPLIFDYNIEIVSNSRVQIHMTAACGNEQNFNPALLVQVFQKQIPGFSLLFYRIHRTGFYTADYSIL
jgi:radical SAM-linked protein